MAATTPFDRQNAASLVFGAASKMLELVPIAVLPLSVCHDIWDIWGTGLD
ncbi:hypothetical protein [uncultured Sphingomonas sp.]|nr:hypothetical protein [uncultured Sphingomonas sp.]